MFHDEQSPGKVGKAASMTMTSIQAARSKQRLPPKYQNRSKLRFFQERPPLLLACRISQLDTGSNHGIGEHLVQTDAPFQGC